MSQQTDSRNPIIRSLDDRSFVIALFIIAPFIILTFIIIIYLRNIEYFKDVSAVYGAWVGIAIGYFFGSRQVENLTQRIEDLMRNLGIANDDYEKALNDCEDTADTLQDKYEKAVDDLRYIMIKHGENLGRGLLERLMNDYNIKV